MPTDEPQDPLSKILEADPRYAPQAYLFVYDALTYTVAMLGREGKPRRGEERHVSGQQLLEGIRRLALRQFGYLAKTVFESWGVTRTSDWGEIVFNLVEGRMMNKTDRDTKEDFADGYDFEEAFETAYFRDGLYKDDDDVFATTSTIVDSLPLTKVQALLDALSKEELEDEDGEADEEDEEDEVDDDDEDEDDDDEDDSSSQNGDDTTHENGTE